MYSGKISLFEWTYLSLQKVLGSFDNVFHVYLMNGLQKYEEKKNFHGGFSRTPRSPRSNDLETQNDKNFIIKSDKN